MKVIDLLKKLGVARAHLSLLRTVLRTVGMAEVLEQMVRVRFDQAAGTVVLDVGGWVTCKTFAEVESYVNTRAEDESGVADCPGPAPESPGLPG